MIGLGCPVVQIQRASITREELVARLMTGPAESFRFWNRIDEFTDLEGPRKSSNCSGCCFSYSWCFSWCRISSSSVVCILHLSMVSQAWVHSCLVLLSGWLHPGSRLCAAHHDIEGAVLRDVDGVIYFSLLKRDCADFQGKSHGFSSHLPAHQVWWHSIFI